MDARCQCGTISFQTPLPQPLALYICHCTACQRQSGSAFGTSAIFPPFDLPLSDDLSCYARPTTQGAPLFCYFCRVCGTRIIHTSPNKKVISVKGGCLEGLDWSKAIHIWTKNAMVPIPEGSESHPDDSRYTEFGCEQAELDQPMTSLSGTETSSDQFIGSSEEPGVGAGTKAAEPCWEDRVFGEPTS